MQSFVFKQNGYRYWPVNVYIIKWEAEKSTRLEVQGSSGFDVLSDIRGASCPGSR